MLHIFTMEGCWMGDRGNFDVPRYEQISIDLAAKITHEEYDEGQKIYGRSTLAGQYNVSPETIRRAVALLQSMGIVESIPGKGIIVLSKDAAKKYLDEFRQRKSLLQAQEEFRRLLEERRKLDEAIELQLKTIMSYSSRLLGILPKVEEITIEEGAELIGKTLRTSNFRINTGATVLSIERKGMEHISPDTEIKFMPGDTLVFVGTNDALVKVESLAKNKKA